MTSEETKRAAWVKKNLKVDQKTWRRFKLFCGGRGLIMQEKLDEVLNAWMDAVEERERKDPSRHKEWIKKIES